MYSGSIISRKESLACGGSRYFTGEPCKHGHIAQRFTNDGARCVECRPKGNRHNVENEKIYREKYNKKYREDHRDELIAYVRAWRDANPLSWRKYKETKARYVRENREKVMAVKKNWKKNNPERLVAMKQKRRAKENQAGGSFTAQDLMQILHQQNYRCAANHCQYPISFRPTSQERKAHADHIVPIAKGGNSFPSNIQCLCNKCNLSKGSKDLHQWLSEAILISQTNGGSNRRSI